MRRNIVSIAPEQTTIKATQILGDLSDSRGEREDLYRWFHQNPELSLAEHDTSARIVETLSGYGLSP